MTAYLVFRVIVFLLVGAIIHSIATRAGMRVYRWWYRMTHEFPLAPDAEQAILARQPVKIRVITATLLSSIISLIALRVAHANALTEMLLWVVGIVVIYVGFMAGPAFGELWGKKEKVFDTVDRIERGELDIEEKAKAGLKQLKEQLNPFPSDEGGEGKAAPPAPPPAQIEEPKERVPDNVSEDEARAMMERFTKRKNSDGN